MAYDAAFPVDDGYLKDFPVGMREQLRSMIQDELVNAGLLAGLAAGNANGNVAVANGNECKNLNAAKLNGKVAADFAPGVHLHNVATASSDGFMSSTIVNKIAGIANNAEVNQNAFSNVKIGATTIQADAKQDTLELVAGTNVALTPDATNDRLTIGITGKIPNAANADNATRAETAGTADNATKAGGLAINTTGTNNQGNQIMRTDGNGYANVGWLNTISGDMGTGGMNRIYCSNDGYLRYKSVANFKASLGLDQVNNTLDANKSVNYANTAATAARLGQGGNAGIPMTFNWSGQGGQPPWLWGGSDGRNMYVYNPSNFSVNYANSAGSVNWGNIIGVPAAALGGIVGYSLAQNGWVKFQCGLILQWGYPTGSYNGSGGATVYTINFPIAFAVACYTVVATDVGQDTNQTLHIYSKGVSNFRIALDTYQGGGRASAICFIAIGN